MFSPTWHLDSEILTLSFFFTEKLLFAENHEMFIIQTRVIFVADSVTT